MATWRGHCARRVDRPSTELEIPYVSISVQGSGVQSNAHGMERAPNESHQLGRGAAEIGPQDPNAMRLAEAPFVGLSMA